MTVNQDALRDERLETLAGDRRIRLAVGVAAFALLTAIGARVAVPLPMTPVPMTLQTLFVLLAGVVLGPWAGAGAMATYLALGVAGMPIFSAGGAGFAWLAGPTGGFLVAFPAAAFLTGLIARPSAGTARLLVGLAVGTAAIFAGGVSWLAASTGAGLAGAVALGLTPFLSGAVLKLGIAYLGVRLGRIASSGR